MLFSENWAKAERSHAWSHMVTGLVEEVSATPLLSKEAKRIASASCPGTLTGRFLHDLQDASQASFSTSKHKVLLRGIHVTTKAQHPTWRMTDMDLAPNLRQIWDFSVFTQIKKILAGLFCRILTKQKQEEQRMKRSALCFFIKTLFQSFPVVNQLEKQDFPDLISDTERRKNLSVGLFIHHSFIQQTFPEAPFSTGSLYRC